MATIEERIEALEGIANRLRDGEALAERIAKLEQDHVSRKAHLSLSESFTNLCGDLVPRLEALEEHPADTGAIPENCPEVGETVRCTSGYDPTYLPQENELYVVRSLKHGSTFPSDAAVDGWQVALRGLSGWYPVERFAAIPAGTLKVNQEALVDTLMGKPVNDPLYDLLVDDENAGRQALQTRVDDMTEPDEMLLNADELLAAYREVYVLAHDLADEMRAGL